LNLNIVTQQIELREVAPADPTEARLLSVLSNQPSHIDDVQRASGLPIASVSSALAVLELKGIVRQVGPMSFVLAREVAIQKYSVNA
jgi:DNA processing protein